MATNWGFRGTVDEFCAKAKKKDTMVLRCGGRAMLRVSRIYSHALKKHGLEVGFLCGGSSSNAQEHLTQFKTAIDAAAGNKATTPLYINCHAGRDYFSFDQNKAFIDHTTQLAKQTGIRILHESHRSRILFAASIARQFIEKLPDLRLTLDISHWCTVHESLLGDQVETVNMALERTDRYPCSA